MSILAEPGAPVDFRLSVATGKYPGVSTVHQFGRAIALGTTESVVALGAPSPFLAAASAVQVKAGGNAADTADGAGARTIRVEGLDASLEPVSADITLAGASASSPTSTAFLRVFRAYVLTAGTYATPYNTGDIVIETTNGTELATMGAERGEAQGGFYTVPAGVVAYVAVVEGRVEKGKPATLRLYQRRDATTTSAPVAARRLMQEWPLVDEDFGGPRATWEAYPAGTDIIITGQTASGSATADVELELFLVDA